MSMTSTSHSVKQRKLTDLRVVDLQRELRSLDVLYDKKELKGSLLEKLRQVSCLFCCSFEEINSFIF